MDLGMDPQQTPESTQECMENIIPKIRRSYSKNLSRKRSTTESEPTPNECRNESTQTPESMQECIQNDGADSGVIPESIPGCLLHILEQS